MPPKPNEMAPSLERKDIDDAWEIFLDEARARYNPEDDGDGDEYMAEVKEVFEEERRVKAA
jgi:hypothetical protein